MNDKTLDRLNKETPWKSSKTLIGLGREASYPMGDFMTTKGQTIDQNHTMGRTFDIMLIFVHKNKLGAKLFRDPLNRIVVKIEEKPSLFETEVWVNYQCDHYIDSNGVHYVFTNDIEHVDSRGKICLGFQRYNTSYKPTTPPIPRTTRYDSKVLYCQVHFFIAWL